MLGDLALTSGGYALGMKRSNGWAPIAGIFGLLSVVVSCLGLFGLAAFTNEQRTKEIGIRKVLGASVAGITGLLAKGFLKLVAVAILIACLGLFGLATYMAEQRTKEIGIRKVLGASVSNVAAMLSKDFLLLVAIAAVPAFPLAWWAMNKWLQDFEYRIGISAWVFDSSAVAALLIALMTVSFQAFKAAIANPVKSLRTE